MRPFAIAGIVEALAADDGSSHIFNPYKDVDTSVDGPDAPGLRRENLDRYLTALEALRPKTLWLGEAPSRRGARRSGVPFTAECRLDDLSERLSVSPCFKIPTRVRPLPPVSPTARMIWEAAAGQPLPLFWNAVMHHPHRGGPHFANRTPGAAEIERHRVVLAMLVETLTIERIVCIGRIAERSARVIAGLPGAARGVEVVYVRHPAQGGAAAFRIGMAAISAGQAR